MRSAFVILRVVATARYLHFKSQELHESAHETIGEAVEEKGLLARTGTSCRHPHGPTKHQEAQAAASLSCQLAYNTSLTALVPTMSASVSPYASVSGQRRKS